VGEGAGQRKKRVTTAAANGSRRRARPLVSAGAVRRWARAAGIEVPDGAIDEQVVDLYLARTHDVPNQAGTVIVLAARAPQPPESVVPSRGGPGFGPPPCPDCSAPGYLDHIDLTHGSQSNRCRACGCRWETAPVTV